MSVKPNEIGIKNTSTILWMEARISAQGGGDEEFVRLDENEFKIWPRKQGQTYHMQYGFWGGGICGPTLNIRPGEIYYITDMLHCQDSNGHDLPYSHDQFRSAKDYPSHDEIPHEEIDQPNSDNDHGGCGEVDLGVDNQSVTNSVVPVPNLIQVVNLTAFNISVRVKKDSRSTEDYFRIKPNEFEKFSREKGSYLIEVYIQERKVRFYCFTNNTYFFKDYDWLEDFTGNVVYQATGKNDRFDENSNIKLINNKSKSKKQILIKNTTNHGIHVRIQSKGKGTEDLQYICGMDEKTWTRDEGKYQIEIVSHIMEKFRFYVDSLKTYKFIDGNEFINEETNKKISQTKDNIFGPSLLDEESSEGIFKKGDAVCLQDEEEEGEGETVKVNSGEFKKKGEALCIQEDDEEEYKDSGINSQDIKKNNEPIKKLNEDTKTMLNSGENDKDIPYYNDIKPDYSGSGTFTDSNFPPDNYSINSINRYTNTLNETHFSHSSYVTLGTENLIWKRPIQIWGKKYCLFKDGIEPEDIHQGKIGNCYFLSALAALSRKPEIIEKIFITRSVSPNGIYEIYYYELNGQKRKMFVDDNFLLLKDFKFLSAQPNGSEIWVLILEKAFAKYEGGYTNMTSGCESWVFKFFTGAVVKHYDSSDIQKNTCWDELVSALKKDHICTAGSLHKSGMTDSDQTPEGIYYGHSYSLLDAKEYNDGNSRIRLVLLRNPHGVGEWTGDFADESTKWTPELEEYFNLDQALGENGIFWMPFEKFKNLFTQMTICYC